MELLTIEREMVTCISGWPPQNTDHSFSYLLHYLKSSGNMPDIVTKKYSNVPGICELHDLLALRNPGENALMKVRVKCISELLRNTLTQVARGMAPHDRALYTRSEPVIVCPGNGQAVVREQAELFKSNVYQLYTT